MAKYSEPRRVKYMRMDFQLTEKLFSVRFMSDSKRIKRCEPHELQISPAAVSRLTDFNLNFFKYSDTNDTKVIKQFPRCVYAT